MASNQEDSLLEDGNHPGGQNPLSTGTFIEGTPSREVLLRIPQPIENAAIDRHLACGDMPMSSGSGSINVISYSHANTVNPHMPVLRGPMSVALQNNNFQPHAAGLGQDWAHGGSTTRMGPIRFHMDNTTTSASTVTREIHTPFEYRPVGQSMNSLYDNQTSLQRSDCGNRGAQRGISFSQNGTGKETSLKPGTYDGSGNWSDYLVLFNMLADHLNWSDGQRATNLAVNFRGTAQSVLSDLNQTQRGNFTALVSALSARFEPVHQSELYHAKIKSRIRQRGESIPELAQDIRKLVWPAYPSAPAEVREQLSKDCFIDSMNSADLEWSVLQGKPKTVDDAIKLALQYEAFQRGKRGRQSDIRPFRASEETLLSATGSQYGPRQQQSNYVSSTVIGASLQPSNNS